MWRIFSKEGLLIDALQRHYCSSSLPSYVPLILITDRFSAEAEVWGMVERNLERLQCNSKESAIIYIGTEFDALPSQLADRTVAHSPFDSFLSYFRDVLPESFHGSRLGVFTASISLERNTVKYLSTWEDISYVTDEFEFLVRNPSGSNVELLRKLCETKESDFLLYNDDNSLKKVKVKDLEGKVVLFFRKMEEFETVALEDVCRELRGNSNYPFEVVWAPIFTDPQEYNKAVTSARLWLILPKPSLLIESYGRNLVVVDEKGRITRDAMPMILRWGTKAYPFSTSREEELIASEWNEFNFNSRSSLEFVFQNTEFFQPRMRLSEMVFLCVGPIENMLEFLPQLSDALTRLHNVIQVFYIAEEYLFLEGDYFGKEVLSRTGKEYETKRREMCSITSLSFDDAYKFWQRVKCLWNELCSQGVNERIVQVRSMLLALVVAVQRNGISIMAVDEAGEMMNGRCEEMVEVLLSHSDDDILMREIESEGLSNVLRKRWTNHHECHSHHPHPLLAVNSQFYWIWEERCGRCDQVIDDGCRRYQCSVCEDYKMCQNCFQC